MGLSLRGNGSKTTHTPFSLPPTDNLCDTPSMRNLTATLCLTIAVLLGSVGESFALPECPGTYNKTTWSNCTGGTILPEGTTPGNTGDLYQGAWVNGKPEGHGVLTFRKNKRLSYVGEFKDGAANGIGTLTGAKGTYIGEFKNDKINGQGTFTFGPSSQWSGDKYVGEHSDGKRNGQGTYTFANGRVKEGIWKDNKFQYAQKVTPTVTASKTLSMVPDLPPPQLVTRTTAMADVQKALQVLDLYSGKLDGIIGPKTRSAIQRWQKRNGYPENGEITEIQIIKLEQEAKSYKSSSLWGDLDWKIRWFIYIIIPLIGFSKICIIISRRRDIHCTWCGSGIKNLKYLNGIAGELFWKYRNNDGSRDKRVKDNYETASFMSKWQCQHCDAVSKYQHYVAQNPSEEAKVWKGELVSPGKEERTATDYNTSKDGEDIDAKSANRKS